MLSSLQNLNPIALISNLLVSWRFRINGRTKPWSALLDTGCGAEDLDLQVVTRGDAGLLREPETCLLLYLLHHVSHHYPVIVGDGHLEQRNTSVTRSVENLKIKNLH